MHKRGRRKAEKTKRQRIHKILDAVLDINGLDERTVKITGNLPTANFEFCGHIGTVIVQVLKDGWYPMRAKDYEKWVGTKEISKMDCDHIVETLRGYKK